MSNNRLQDKILRTFVLQGLLIGVAVILGILLTNWLLSHFLVQEALERETAHYWQLVEEDPSVQLSNSLNLRGYLFPRDQAKFPWQMEAGIADGYHEVKADVFNSLYVSSRGDQRMFLFFNRSGVESLISLYGLVPLAVVLSLLYLVLWFSYLRARRAVSPTIELARIMKTLPEEKGVSDLADLLPPSLDTEVAMLVDAIEHYRARIARFVDRERAFTRDASHELRTPITVIAMSAELLAAKEELSDQDSKLVDRIQRACHDMQELIDAFLALSREQDGGLRTESVDICALAAQELEGIEQLAKQKGIATGLECGNCLVLNANKRVVSILVGNLIRNAVNYTDRGRVSVKIGETQIQVIDSGRGISEEKLASIYEPHVRGGEHSRAGYGVGLAIVKRLCEQNGWQISLASEEGAGTTATLNFA
ncbi:HAMP domain-containing histidine kinase [Microbulbifer salipaludis]|uniref:histidine kinase n=1 Tax=Microbulbifer salipaludis TaxID=187980 RepID=A0ABS3E2N6_9GAMM|nr:HAMP domain-containing sensor histidine kinase [Microbulbifer salipaludis]MBN8429562.1 HAMP domain-containing histidine kinase [Microbulbifer salipaludis]